MIIPTWENYTDKLLKDEAVAPYQSSIAIDSGFEEGSFHGVKLADGSILTPKIADAAITTAKIQDASITNAKIKDLSWDKGYGGTLTLGGANNVNGILSVKDASAVEKVRIDNTGITVNTGKITIKDDTDANIIDAKGLVSVNNFMFNSLTATNLCHLFTSTTFEDVPNSSMSFTLSRAARVAFWATVLIKTFSVSGGSQHGMTIIAITVDGINYQPYIINEGFYSDIDADADGKEYKTLSTHLVLTLGAGNHTVKLQRKISNIEPYNNTLGCYDSWTLTYLVLGK